MEKIKKDVGDTIVLGEETFDIIGKDDINDPGEYANSIYLRFLRIVYGYD